MEASHPAGEWSRAWPVAAAGLVGMTMMSLHTGALGVLMKPLGQAFGWGRSEISGGLTILTILQAPLIPLVSLIIPRVGVKRVALAGGLLLALGFILAACSTANIWTWYLSWVVLGLAMTGISPLSWTTAINRAFDRNRGVALSVALSGVGVATFLSPLLSAYALQWFGWRASFVALAVLVLAILLPLTFLFMNRVEDFDPYQPQPVADPVQRDHTGKHALLASPRVWQIMAASFLMAGCVGMIMIHLQAMMRDAGASATEAARYFTIIGPMLIVGRLVSGVMLDHFPTRLVATVMFMLPIIVAVLLLGYNGSPLLGIVICVIFGVGYGSENDILAYVCSRYFAIADYPMVYSLVYCAFSLGYGTSVAIAGAMFDHFGSYAQILHILIAGVGLGIALILALGRERKSGPVLHPAPNP